MYSHEEVGNLVIIDMMIKEFKRCSPQKYFELIDSCINNPLSRVQYRKYFNIAKKVWDSCEDKDKINAGYIINILKG